MIPVAVYFLWERRRALLEAPARPSTAGIALVAASLLVFVAGRFGAELHLTRVSLLGVLAGTVLALGVAAAQDCRIAAASPPTIRLPSIVFNQITFPLQGIASRAGEAVIAAAGVPVLREGNILHVPGRALEVVEACSGIRSLMSLLMPPSCSVLHRATGGGRIAIALAVPIAIVANAARVAGTGLAAYWISPAAAEGFFHSFSGWMVFVVALAGLMGVHGLWEMTRARRARRTEATWLPAR